MAALQMPDVRHAEVGKTGPERFAEDVQENEVGFLDAKGQKQSVYRPYPKQQEFHVSHTKHRLLGGAAGPGKSLALIMDHLMGAYDFTDPEQAKQVHTLLLRRTHPRLEDTLITRFREKVPKELYKNYNETKKICTWLNGATTHFDSMQYEHDVYGKQGQWFKIGYDEMAEFTFKQWAGISAWNRCPVSPFVTKDGASNPIGVGAGWCKSLFIDKQPYEEMDESQRKGYNHADYEYFPCTYKDNPIYANDPQFLAALEQYPAAERDALKYAIWGVAGGYFSGAWDPAAIVYDAATVKIQPWHRRWMGGDWGFSHWATTYWYFMDDWGVIRIYKELVVNKQDPAMLAETIIRNSFDPDGSMPAFEYFMYSHDAFHQKSDINTVANTMGKVLVDAKLPFPISAGTDKIGREQLMYQLMRQRVATGEGYNEETGDSFAIQTPALQIERSCQRLIQNIPLAPREEHTDLGREKIAQFPGLDMIDGAAYGLYGKYRGPEKKPFQARLQEELVKIPLEGTGRYIRELQMKKEERESGGEIFYIGRRPKRRR